MASSESSVPMADCAEVALESYQTALAILPPVHTYPKFNNLRSLHDKAFTKWPPHINLLYPFADAEKLPEVAASLKEHLSKSGQKPFRLELARADVFEHRNSATIWLGPSGETEDFDEFVAGLFGLFGANSEKKGFQAHLTLGQTSREKIAVEIMRRKAERLGNSGTPLSWIVDRVVLLKRDAKGDMQTFEEISFGVEESTEEVETVEDETASAFAEVTFEAGVLIPQNTYFYSKDDQEWKLFSTESQIGDKKIEHDVKVSTYNVMTDAPFPPPVERYPALVKAILSAQTPSKPSVVILQEVTDEFLEYLLADEKIRQTLPFVTHSGEEAFRSLRNIVVFANAASGGFEWQYLPFRMRHKGVSILQFPHIAAPGDGDSEEDPESPLVVVAVHLSSGWKDSAISSRNAQMKMIVSTLNSEYSPYSPWIIAGDFNLPTSHAGIENGMQHKVVSLESLKTHRSTIDISILADVWEETYPGEQEDDEYTGLYQSYGARKAGEYGATFDPLANPLAAEKMQVGRHVRPHRYDRILIRRKVETDEYSSNRLFHINSVSRFGFPSEDDGMIGSDHWGVTATLQLLDPNAEPAISQQLAWDDLPNHIPDEKFESTLRGLGLIPSIADYQVRQAIVHAIRETLTANPSTVDSEEYPAAVWEKLDLKNLVLEPVGSVGMGLFDKNSDVDLTCVGEVTPAFFYRVAGVRIRKLGEEYGVRLSRYVEGAKVGMMELEVKGIMVDLHYCQAPRLVERWKDVPNIPASDIIFALPSSTRRKINAYRDMRYLLSTIPNYGTYKIAYRALKLWSKRRGIYSSRFGFLGGIHLTYLLSRVSKLLAQQNTNFSVCELIGAFFTEYSTFDWADQEVVDPDFGNIVRKRLRSEPICILTVNAPAINVSANATKHSIFVLNKEVTRANELLRAGKSWLEICGEEDANISEFLNSYKSFVKLDVHFWGHSKGRGRNLVGWVESRIVLLLVDLQTNIPSLRIHAFPGRFTDTSSTDELRSFYLLGCVNTAVYSDPQITKIQRNKFEAALAKFNKNIQANQTVYSPEDCYTGVSHVKRDGALIEGVDGHPVLDKNSTWDFLGEAAFLSEDVGSAVALDDEEEEEELEDDASTAHDSRTPTSKSLPTNRSKLRPAQDILSRLRWDPALDIKDYLIGYEDRFKGVMEMSAENWSVEKTDENWVPMHRVVWFRRKEDGVLVWDRRRAVDLVFGSGVGMG